MEIVLRDPSCMFHSRRWNWCQCKICFTEDSAGLDWIQNADVVWCDIWIQIVAEKAKSPRTVHPGLSAEAAHGETHQQLSVLRITAHTGTSQVTGVARYFAGTSAVKNWAGPRMLPNLLHDILLVIISPPSSELNVWSWATVQFNQGPSALVTASLDMHLRDKKKNKSSYPIIKLWARLPPTKPIYFLKIIHSIRSPRWKTHGFRVVRLWIFQDN